MNSQVIQYSIQVPQSRPTFIIMKAPGSVVLAASTHGNGPKTYAVSKNCFAMNRNFQPAESSLTYHDAMSDYPFLDVVEEETIPFDNLKTPYTYTCSDPLESHLSPELMNEDCFDIDDKFLQDLLLPEDDFKIESYSLENIELDDGRDVKDSPHNFFSSQSPDSFNFSPSQSPDSFNFSSSQSPLINESSEPIMMESECSSPSDSIDLASYVNDYQSSSSSDFGDQEDIANIYLLPDNEDSIVQSLDDDLLFSIDEHLDDNDLSSPGTSANTSKRKSVYSPEERRQRKKASNRCAAYRYRQKQKVKVSDSEGELKDKITNLRRMQNVVNEKRQSLDLLRKLVEDVIKARKKKRF